MWYLRAMRVWSRSVSAAVLAASTLAASALACGGASSAAAGPKRPPGAGAGAAEKPAQLQASPEAIVASADRTAQDRATDERRHPVELLRFLDVRPGARVADLGAGSGYTTELLVRAVGEGGSVYAQNNALTLEKYVRESWPERLRRPVNQRVVRMDLEFEAPFFPEARDLDLVTLLFSYHDIVAQGGDRAQMNLAVFEALEPGGYYVVADHSAEPGGGVDAARTLHRMDQELLRKEVEAAGFEFVEGATFLSDTADDHSTVSYQVGFKTDRFVLKFRKPDRPAAE